MTAIGRRIAAFRRSLDESIDRPPRKANGHRQAPWCRAGRRPRPCRGGADVVRHPRPHPDRPHPRHRLGERARSLADRARELSGDLHRLAYDLHPAILAQLGLVPALRQLAEGISALYGVAVDLRAADRLDGLPPDVELALYRVAQEALQNVRKYSSTQQALVSLRGSALGVSLVASDQGRGFEVTETSRASLGLGSMAERMRLVGGELRVKSAVGRGTVVSARVPRRALAPATEAGDKAAEARPA